MVVFGGIAEATITKSMVVEVDVDISQEEVVVLKESMEIQAYLALP